MKRKLFCLLTLVGLIVSTSMNAQVGLTADFVDEATMKQDLLQMLANFATYMKNDWYNCQAPNSLGEECGFFNGENSGGSNEQGVRPNADLSMICAFLVKYGKPAGVSLPSGVTWTDIETMAIKSLVFAYSTHKANKLKVCSGGAYWGSTSTSDSVWESSLWAMSVAYSAFFQWDKLTEAQRGYIYAMLKAECNYELGRSIPTGYSGDTKAEENGWEADILAATLGLFPDDPLAPQWFARLRQFAVNSYSHASDLGKQKALDPWYDNTSAADLYLGKNIYDDYTLQNHNMFHTSYLNVVMQELGEAALALKMFQQKEPRDSEWKTNALMHNNQEVMDLVLNYLATSDGELAMPNGNDWSLFLFDQITSYSTQACIGRDANALLLENLAYKNIKLRQGTTTDGSWLLRPDVGARRMGVEAHRVMMTWLMHEYFPTSDLSPTTWDALRSAYSSTRYFPGQNIVRSMSKDRFTCFSWNSSLPDYSGVIVPNDPAAAKIMVPFRTHHTGNLLGVYSKADYTAGSVTGNYALFPDAYAMNGIVTFNSIPQSFCLYATSGNAVILVDALKANSATTVSSEQGGMMGISVDEFTATQRRIQYEGGSVVTDGSSYSTWTSPWSNIDDYLGFVVTKHGETVTGAFGDRSNNNSVMTAKIYPSYSGSSSPVGTTMNHIRGFVYYTGVTAAETKTLSDKTKDLTTLASWPEGWHGILVPDPDGTYYMLLTNLFASDDTPWENLSVTCPQGAPVFRQTTTIEGSNSTATFYCAQNYNIATELKLFVSGATKLLAVQADGNSRAAYLQNESAAAQNVVLTIIDADGVARTANITVPQTSTVYVHLDGAVVVAENATWPGDYVNAAYGASATAVSYDGAHLPFDAIDNNTDTYYKSLATASSGSEHLDIALRNQYRIDKIIVTAAPGESAPTSIIAQYGQSSDAFTDLTNISSTTTGGQTVITFDPVDARFVRLRLLGQSQVSIAEVGIYGSVSNSTADKEETLNVFSNPSFEQDNTASLPAVNNSSDGLRGYTCTAPTGWTVSGTAVTELIVTADCYTDNNFGKVTTLSDKNQAYYLRQGWSTGTTTLSTPTTTTLPAGKYRASIDYRSAYANGANSSFTFSAGGTTSASTTFSTGSTGVFTSAAWQTLSVEFTLGSETAVSPTLAITWKSGGSCIMFDNLRITKVKSITDLTALHKQQIISNGGDATFLLQDPKCESAAGTLWSGSTGAISIREHWSGEGYQDVYQERTSSGTISQTLTNMPRGTYRLVAALRAYNGGKITPRLNSTSGATFTGTGNNSTSIPQINKNGVQMPFDSQRGFTTKTSGRGWQWGSVTATTDSDGSLTVAFDMTGTSWMSIDDVHLYYVSDGTETFCENINATEDQLEVSLTGKTLMADIILANPNTVIRSEQQVFTDNAAANNNLVGGTTMQNLVLYDGYDFGMSAPSVSIADASYQRSMSSKWGTLVLPFPTQSTDRLQLYQLLGMNEQWLYFKPVDYAPAGSPVVFRRLTDDNLTISARQVTGIGTDAVPETNLMSEGNIEGLGYFVGQTNDNADTYYINGDKFWLTGGSINVAPFRSVFSIKSEVKSLGIKTGEPLPTNIGTIENGKMKKENRHAVYDFGGRHIANNIQLPISNPQLPQGLYIVNGQKLLIR